MTPIPIIPPINLWNVPSRDWFDNGCWLKPHSNETANRVRVARVAIKYTPMDFIRGR